MCNANYLITSSGNHYVIREKDGNVQVLKKQDDCLWHDVENDNIVAAVGIHNSEVIHIAYFEEEAIRT
jgi:hypothetical protein